ncbi:MAG TPA: AzlD domain-containing protein [Burkholderiales bacterium]|jgi:branched-subunit amino acid transport protein|nr:AzlD domain-containing protein [Burkholderiales bacterium]
MVWAMILATAAVTFVLRFSFLGTLKPHAVPERFREALRFVPPAVFAAIVLPPVLMRDDVLHLGLDNPRLIAALAAVVVARLTRSIAWTIAGGMVALWVAQWVLA